MILVKKCTIFRSTRSFNYSNSRTTFPVVLPLWKVRRASKACEKRNVCPTKGGRRLSCSKPSNILSIFSTLSNIQIKLKAWQNKFWCSYFPANSYPQLWNDTLKNRLIFITFWAILILPSMKSMYIRSFIGHRFWEREREPTFESPRSFDFRGWGFTALPLSQKSMGNKDLNSVWALWVRRVRNLAPKIL